MRARADAESHERFLRLRESGDRDVRNELVERHRWLAVHCAKRFARRGEPLDDLLQVAQLGLLKAVERYDVTYGLSFPSFAIPTVMGELKRYFRDVTWALRVPRGLKELHLEINQASESLTQRLHRTPRPTEIAVELGVSVEEVLAAMEAGSNYWTVQLTPVGDDGDDDEPAPDGVTLGSIDLGMGRVERRLTVTRLVEGLDERDRRIVELRFFEDLPQHEIAARVGVSQVHVSRLLRQILRAMRSTLDDGWFVPE